MFTLKKNAIIIIFTALIGAVILCMTSCAKSPYADFESADPIIIEKGEFSVNFLRLSLGECTIVRLKDDKILMIDSGEDNQEDYAEIKSILTTSNISKIDYYVTSHVYSVGNLENLLQDFALDTVFLPKIKNTDRFLQLNSVLKKATEYAQKIRYASLGDTVKGQDYFFTFLSPLTEGSLSMTLNLETGDVNIKDVEYSSAVIYLEHDGKRFIFGGDANKNAFNVILEQDRNGLYNIFNGNDVNLDKVDLYKVSNHASEKGLNEEFFNKIKPKMAVVNIDKSNIKNNPSSPTLLALNKANPDIEIYRTDETGSLSIIVDNDNLVKKNPT